MNETTQQHIIAQADYLTGAFEDYLYFIFRECLIISYAFVQ